MTRSRILPATQLPALTFVGPPGRTGFGGPFQAPLRRPVFARRDTFGGFAVQRPGDGSRTALGRKQQDFDFEIFLAAGDTQHIAWTNGAGGFATMAVDVDLAAADRPLRERAGLEEAGRPQPLVDSDRLRVLHVYQGTRFSGIAC